MRPEPEMIPVLIDAAKALKGSPKRLFMAKTVRAMGRGGQRWAEEHLGWCRDTIRKGTHELRSGVRSRWGSVAARRRRRASAFASGFEPPDALVSEWEIISIN